MGTTGIQDFGVVPPGSGSFTRSISSIWRKACSTKDGVYFPDTLVGTDSHTTMINGLGVVGWGVGGIEAEAGMLGQPVYFLTPEVVGVHLTGALREGVTATDLVLHITQMLRKAKVVGKFVEFFGAGATSLPVTDRATIANMAPEYGATMGFFPDRRTRRSHICAAPGEPKNIARAFEDYYQRAGALGHSAKRADRLLEELELDLADVVPAVAGPKRPQDRIELTAT